jgi:hypothetical protein
MKTLLILNQAKKSKSIKMKDQSDLILTVIVD